MRGRFCLAAGDEIGSPVDQQRKDANLVERARGYQRLKEKFALGQEEIANRLGVSQPTVSRLLSLLDEPAEIQELVAKDKIGAKHLPALDTIEDPEQRIALASEAARNGWSARETERRVHKALRSRARKPEDGSAKQKGNSLVKHAHASLLGEWFQEVFHFFHSMTELRRALKAAGADVLFTCGTNACGSGNTTDYIEENALDWEYTVRRAGAFKLRWLPIGAKRVGRRTGGLSSWRRGAAGFASRQRRRSSPAESPAL